jgi:hypothetical protein
MPIKQIPKEIGLGGAYMAPGGTTGDPDLKELLNFAVKPLEPITDAAADTTWSLNEATLARSICQRIVDCFPGATVVQADVNAINSSSYDAATKQALDRAKVDINAQGFAAVSDTIPNAGAWDAGGQSFLNNAKTRMNLLTSDLMTANIVPATYTATTQGILSSLLVRIIARQRAANR